MWQDAVSLTVTLIQFVLASIAAIIIAILFEDRLSIVLAKYLGNFVPKNKRKINGLWYSVYWFKSIDGEIRRHTHLMHIKSFGKQIIGQTLAGAWNVYRIEAKIASEIYLTGEWEHSNGNDIYHGSLQFILSPEGDTMHGAWLGFNKQNIVGAGPWILIRITPDTDKGTQKIILNKLTYVDDGQEKIGDSQIEMKVEKEITRYKAIERFITWKDLS